MLILHSFEGDNGFEINVLFMLKPEIAKNFKKN